MNLFINCGGIEVKSLLKTLHQIFWPIRQSIYSCYATAAPSAVKVSDYNEFLKRISDLG